MDTSDSDLIANPEEILSNHNDEVEPSEGKQSILPKPVSSIALKQQPDQLCSCPLHCDNKIGKERRVFIYKEFEKIGDHALQNQYIQRHIKIKSIAKRLWEDEIVEKKIQRRVTCKYLIPVTGTVMESFSFAKTLTYDNVKFSLDLSLPQENGGKPDAPKDSKETAKTIPEPVNRISTNSVPNEALPDNTKPAMNDSLQDSITDGTLDNSVKENGCEGNSPLSFNDNDSVNTSPDDMNASDLDNSTTSSNKIKYVEVCQKAFMNMHGITEKRIRWQREKLILKSRYLAEKKRKEFEEMDRTLTLARSLGAGCQPLFALLEKSNCTHLSDQLMVAIEDDITLVNNFFHNQLWKPEDIMNKSVHFSSRDSLETEM